MALTRQPGYACDEWSLWLTDCGEDDRVVMTGLRRNRTLVRPSTRDRETRSVFAGLQDTASGADAVVHLGSPERG